MLTDLGHVELAEADSAQVGEAYGLTIGPGGLYLVPDRKNATIRMFDSDGTYRGSFGKAGSGPDEVGRFPLRVDVVSDSLFAVHTGDGSVKGLTFPQSRLTWWVVPPGRGFPIGLRGDTVYFNFVDSSQRTSMVAIHGPTGAARRGGPYRNLMGANRSLALNFSATAVTWLDADTVAVMHTTADSLFIGPFGGPFRAFEVPVRNRRGARPDLLAAILDHESAETIMAAAANTSTPLLLAAISRELVAVVTADQTLLKDAMRMTAALHVAIVDRGNGRSCAEARVPVSDDPHPRAVFRGDTLLVLVQEETSERSVRTMIRKYGIDTSQCTWR